MSCRALLDLFATKYIFALLIWRLRVYPKILYPIQKNLTELGIIALYLQPRKLLFRRTLILQPILFKSLRESVDFLYFRTT
jgi:hypothetical protein